MAYEIEQRAKLSELEFGKLKEYLDKNAEFIAKKEMISLLFREPEFLRIRVIKGKDYVIVTHKSGDYNDKARKETEFNVKLGELKNFISKKEKEGFKKCSSIKTLRYSYNLEGLKVELNEIDFLGRIVEIEVLTENKKEINSLDEKVNLMFDKLNLKKLDPKEYQKMMDRMYKKSLGPVGKARVTF